MKTITCVLRLIRYVAGRFTVVLALRALIFAAAPQITGLLIRLFFDAISGNAGIGLNPYAICALLVSVALARSALIFADIPLHFGMEFAVGALLRKNMFENVLDQPGAQALPDSPGETISRFRGDTDAPAMLVNQLPFLFGSFLFSAVAFVIMMRINARIALIVFLPLLSISLVVRALMNLVEKLRKKARETTGVVTGFIGEIFNSMEAVKTEAAEPHISRHFVGINLARLKALLWDVLLSNSMYSIFHSVSNIGTGIILILASQQMRAGTFTIGDFALFVYYLDFVSFFIMQAGSIFVQYKQTGVSVKRMQEVLKGVDDEELVKPSSVHLHGDLPEIPYYEKEPKHLLQQLRVEGLTYHFPNSDKGIEDIDLWLERGSVTVVTGRIGSGKTTLLRVLLGLLVKDSGRIYWNETPVDDPSTFLLPPRSAYTPQVPRLFSETVRDNILLGIPEPKVNLPEAVHGAAMEDDLKLLDDGLDTLVGTKGVKLSGGQLQRTAAARMLVRDPELLVFDDLSSALDVETEKILWQRTFRRVRERGATCLVVSHRKTAFQYADAVVVLRDGRIESQGSVDTLLEVSPEFQRIWRGEVT